MKIGYYPGCALHGSSNDYDQSLKACLGALDVSLQEVKEWICCGATAAHSLNHKLALALPARNLALAERDGFKEVFAPCPLCSMQLLKVRKAVADDGVRQELSQIVEAETSRRRRGPQPDPVVRKHRARSSQERRQAAAGIDDGGVLLRLPAASPARGRQVRRLRAAQIHGNAAGGARRQDGRVELQDRVLRRRHDHGERRHGVGTRLQDSYQRRRARRKLRGRRLPHVPRQPGHEAGGSGTQVRQETRPASVLPV